MRKQRIINKALLPLVIFFLILCVILLHSIKQNVLINLNNYHNKEITSIANALNAEIDNKLRNNALGLNFYKQSNEIQNLLIENQIDNNKLFTQLSLLKETVSADEVYLLSKDGKTLLCSTSKKDNTSNYLENQIVIKNTITSGQSSGICYVNNNVSIISATKIIKDEEVLAIGVIEEIISKDSFVDWISDIFLCEFTIFINDTRISTSIQNKAGARIIGTKLNNEKITSTVLINNNRFFGDSLINDNHYLSLYFPINFIDEKTHGMFFIGKPVSIITATTNSLMKNVTPLLFIVFILLLLFIILIIQFVILKPLNKAKKAIHNLNSDKGNADLTYKINIKSKDEIGQLCSDIDLFISKQHEIICQLNNAYISLNSINHDLTLSSQESASAVSQIMSNIDSVNKQNKFQNSSLESTNALVTASLSGINNLSSLIENQSSGIIESSASIEEMLGNISSIDNSVNKMLHEFSELVKITVNGQNQLKDVDNRVSSISEQSANLINANSIIQQISAQTNLLAMNAAIEAAHAGDAGAGFAVVADEIRKLAENSGRQSKSISQELKNISQSISNVVTSSKQSKEAFEIITEKISDTNNFVDEIAAALNEQTITSKQVLEALKQINSDTSQVQLTAKKLKNDSENVFSEMEKLTEVSRIVYNSMDEMSSGTKEISKSTIEVSDLANTSNNNVSTMKEIIAKFII